MIGLDHLGLGNKHYKLSECIAAHPQGWALGCFARTFGDALPNVRKFLQSGKVPAFRLQAWWHNGHEMPSIDWLKKELPRWEALARQFPSVKFYISFACEYRSKDKAKILKCLNLVKQLCPSCIPVQTPEGGSSTVPGFIIEKHGKDAAVKAGQIASTDGHDIYNIDASSWMEKNAQAEITFLWGARFNLRDATLPMPPPPDRTASPGVNYIQSIVRLAFPKGPMPTPIFQGEVIPVKKPLLYKTHGEDAPGDAKRDNRPLIMLPKKTPFVEVVTFAGQSIGKFMYFGGYPNGTHRFYSGLPGGLNLYGFEIAERLKQISGYEWGYFKQGKKFYGPVNFAFRRGYFQK